MLNDLISVFNEGHLLNHCLGTQCWIKANGRKKIFSVFENHVTFLLQLNHFILVIIIKNTSGKDWMT